MASKKTPKTSKTPASRRKGKPAPARGKRVAAVGGDPIVEALRGAIPDLARLVVAHLESYVCVVKPGTNGQLWWRDTGTGEWIMPCSCAQADVVPLESLTVRRRK